MYLQAGDKNPGWFLQTFKVIWQGLVSNWCTFRTTSSRFNGTSSGQHNLPGLDPCCCGRVRFLLSLWDYFRVQVSVYDAPSLPCLINRLPPRDLICDCISNFQI